MAGRLEVQWNSTVAPTGMTIFRVTEAKDPGGARPSRPPATPRGSRPTDDDDDDDDDDDNDENDDDDDDDDDDDARPRGVRCPLSATPLTPPLSRHC